MAGTRDRQSAVRASAEAYVFYRWMNLSGIKLPGFDLPIIQAPMAGVQGSALAVAVSNAGGLGSLPCALLSADALRKELAELKAQTDKPFNVNFFCHTSPCQNAQREQAWRATL